MSDQEIKTRETLFETVLLALYTNWMISIFFEISFDSNKMKFESAVDAGELRRAIDIFYEMMGWNGDGVPLPGTLHELGIGWAVDYIPD